MKKITPDDAAKTLDVFKALFFENVPRLHEPGAKERIREIANKVGQALNGNYNGDIILALATAVIVITNDYRDYAKKMEAFETAPNVELPIQ